MKKNIIVMAILALTTGMASSAWAQRVTWSVGISSAGFSAGLASTLHRGLVGAVTVGVPVYVKPAPVCAPAPVVVHHAPIVVAPPRPCARPMPVVMAPAPILVPAYRGYYAPQRYSHWQHRQPRPMPHHRRHLR